MATFAASIQQDRQKAKRTAEIQKDPLSSIVPAPGEDQVFYGFHLDKCFVKLSTVKNLRCYIEYIKLSDITSKCNLKNWFTIAVIGEIKKQGLLLTDLRTGTIHAKSTLSTNFKQFDVVIITNAKFDNYSIEIKDFSQIKRIGLNSKVKRCSRADPSNKKCSLYIDPRNGTGCDYHVNQSFLEAGMNRAFLKQTTMSSTPQIPDSMMQDPDDEFKNMPKDDTKLINAFIESHPYSRAAKLQMAASPKKPTIGKGFHEGDMISLI